MKIGLWSGVAVLAAAVVVAWMQFGFGPPDVKTLSAADKANCGLSVEVTEGPYYISGTSAVKDANLNSTGLPGTPITVYGHVYEGLDNSKPVANATIEIWHADASGSYHPNANGAVTKYKPEDIALRGVVTTHANGTYSFNTIYPGEYTGRTRHIHFKITNGAKTLTTQLIIPSLTGDKLTFDEDSIAKGLPKCALLKFDTSATPQTASFDFRL